MSRRTPARTLLLQIATAAAIFVALTADVLLGGPLTGLDDEVRDAVRAHQVPALHQLANDVTLLLAPPVTVGVLLLAALMCVVRSRSLRRPLLLTAGALTGLLLLVLAMKGAVARGGPSGDPGDGAGYFPSGHTSGALVGLGTSAVLLIGPGRTRRRALVAVAAVGGLVAVSLVYCAYHWLTDVLAAGAVGWLVLTVVVLLERQAASRD